MPINLSGTQRGELLSEFNNYSSSLGLCVLCPGLAVSRFNYSCCKTNQAPAKSAHQSSALFNTFLIRTVCTWAISSAPLTMRYDFCMKFVAHLMCCISIHFFYLTSRVCTPIPCKMNFLTQFWLKSSHNSRSYHWFWYNILTNSNEKPHLIPSPQGSCSINQPNTETGSDNGLPLYLLKLFWSSAKDN